MFFVNYLPEFLYQPLKLSNVRPTGFANSKHAQFCNFLKNKSLAQGFSCEICEICRNFFAEHHRATASGYSSINGSEGRIGKLNHKL